MKLNTNMYHHVELMHTQVYQSSLTYLRVIALKLKYISLALTKSKMNEIF